MNKKNEVIFMAVDFDEYEFPRVWFDDIDSLAKWAGMSTAEMRYYIQYKFVDFRKKVRYKKVFF